MCLLRMNDVSFSYNGKIVAYDINFSLNEGDYLIIAGENGSGKTTLIKGILGLHKPHTGEIIYGNSITNKSIGYLPQKNSLQSDFPASVSEVVISGCINRLGFFPFYKNEHKKIAFENMERLKISHLKNKCFHELSGGQQQRVLLARALCAANSLILLDEPVAGLDPDASEEMYNIIAQLNKEDKMTIIMVSHDTNRAKADANLILHLHSKPLYFGSTENYSYKNILEGTKNDN